jgi:hypothetical protein
MSLFFLPKVAPVSGGESYPGARLYFYTSGTSAAVNVYTDSALTTAHSVPVTADSGGVFAPIYVNPTVSYRVVLKNSAGSTVWDVDPFPANSFETYPQTTAETAASVTPTDYDYPAGDVRRYGWVSGGSAATNATALQQALDSTPTAGGVVTIPEGTGSVSGTILWPRSGTTLRSITIRGQSGHSVPASAQSIIAYTGTGTLFDLRGGAAMLTTGQVTLEDLTLTGPYVASTKAIDAYSLQGSVLRRVSVSGFDTAITIANYCYYCIFEAVTVTSARSKGWSVGLLNGTTFDRCRIDAIDTSGPVSGTGIGIDIVSGGAGANFAGCWFENTRTAVKCKDTQQLVFAQCYWEACIFGVYVDTDTTTLNQVLQFYGSNFYHVHNNSSLVFGND